MSTNDWVVQWDRRRTTEAGELGSIPDRVKPKTWKSAFFYKSLHTALPLVQDLLRSRVAHGAE